jgi:hypothetical protein
MYPLTVKALFAEAGALVVVGFLVGLVFDSWRAIIVAQGLFVACEYCGYLIEGWLHRRRERCSTD